MCFEYNEVVQYNHFCKFHHNSAKLKIFRHWTVLNNVCERQVEQNATTLEG
jgi:hypothetical protein